MTKGIGDNIHGHCSRDGRGQTLNCVCPLWPQLWKATGDKALAGRKSWEVFQSGDLERGFPAWVPWARLHLLSTLSSLVRARLQTCNENSRTHTWVDSWSSVILMVCEETVPM